MRRTSRFGFTLVELLVVVGIIGLLIGVLLPALSKAREASKRAVCLANLRTLGQCYSVYVNDSKGYGFFEGYGTPTAKLPPQYKYYQQFWFAALYQLTSAPTAYVWDSKQGYLTNYFKNPVFLNCPSDPEYTAPYQLYGAVPLTTYAYNANLAYYNVQSVSQLQVPSETFALMDALAVNILGQTTGTYTSTLPYAGKTPVFHGQHTGKGNVLWYDGHASSETPYLTDLAANLNTSNAAPAACQSRDRLKIGYLTRLSHVNTPDAALMSNPASPSVNYYYWASKTNMN